ncbi:MAG: polyprenyl synthetase family protein [Dehalococcoidales bacterium]
MELRQIYAPIQEDLEKVKENLKSVSKIDYTWLSEQLSYVVSETGKGMRPAMTLLSGKSFDYDLEHLMPMAVSVELMHTATLVHDDAIDKASTRRGQATINSVWGDEIAILMGDFLFAKAGEVVADTQMLRVVKLFSQTLGIISSGEIGQFRGAFNYDQTRESYFRRIYRKTASLFSLSTQSGAILAHAPEESVVIMKEYGDNLGLAFQIVDDILDFTSTEERMGKPVGSDLIQGTLTLPAMLVIERDPEGNPVKKLFETKDKKYVEEAIDQVRNSSVIKECYKIAGEYRDTAIRNLKTLPKTTARQSLFDLADFVVKQGS